MSRKHEEDMMKHHTNWIKAAALTALLATTFSADAAPPQKEPTKLVLVGYPDGSTWLTTEALRRLGEAYKKTEGAADIIVRPRTTYKQAREMVVHGRAAGMILSERINRFRAYASQTGPEQRGYATFKLNRFIPIATRVVKSRNETVAKFRLGFATNEITPSLQHFLDFLKSDAARKALKPMFDVRVRVPRDKPKLKYKGLQRGPKPVKLDEPILTY